ISCKNLTHTHTPLTQRMQARDRFVVSTLIRNRSSFTRNTHTHKHTHTHTHNHTHPHLSSLPVYHKDKQTCQSSVSPSYEGQNNTGPTRTLTPYCREPNTSYHIRKILMEDPADTQEATARSREDTQEAT